MQGVIIKVDMHVQEGILFSLVNASAMKCFVYKDLFVGNELQKSLKFFRYKVVIEFAK